MANLPSQSPVDYTALLLRLSRMFNSTLDLDEVLSVVMDEVISALHAERGFIMLQEPGKDFQFKVAHGIHREAIQAPQSEISLSIARQVATSGLALLTSNAQDDERLSSRRSVIFLGLRSVLCVPLSIKERILGVIYVDNRLVDGIFTQQNLELLNAIASSAAVAIENARLYQLAIEKGRLERELQIARQVQSSLLPKEFPIYPGWEFSALWQPARQVAGDFYDFIRLGRDQLGLLIADVTGEGVPAALFMTMAHTVLRASLRKPSTAAADMARANRLICADSTMGYFVTVFYAGLDLKSGLLTYVNAGHPPVCWNRPGTQQVNLLARTGMALGIDAGTRYVQQTIQLEPGDYIFGYTDGVTEAFNRQQDEFGQERLISVLRQENLAKPAQVLDAVLQAVMHWTADPEIADDITLIIASRS